MTYTASQLLEKTSKELVALYNHIGRYQDNFKELTTWKKAKTDLVNLILQLQDAVAQAEALDTDAALDELEAEEPQAEEPQAEEPQAEEPQAEEPQAEEPQAEEPQAEEPQAPVKAIRTNAEPFLDAELLEQIASSSTIKGAAEAMLSLNDTRGQPQVGYPQMLRVIKQAFPGAATTIACLRWYAVRLREVTGVQTVRYRRRAAARAGDGT
jgi:chemotaxis protein histidine kinase CheA